MLRGLWAIVTWGWSPIIITALAIIGFIYEWPVELFILALGVILFIGLVVVMVRARERQQELSSLRLRQLAGYFKRRFTGDSSLSIFAIINSLFKVENPQLWEWARACDMSQRVYNTWCNSFLDRAENDNRTGRFSLYLRIYLNELWLINSHYYEFIEQFYEIAQKVEIPIETVDQYNRFVVEYNTFIDSFQNSIADLKKVARTEIEPPSVKIARELSVPQMVDATGKEEAKPSPPTEHKGYILG